MNLGLSNPIVLFIGAVALFAIILFCNKRNTKQQRARRTRNFRKSYYDRKKEREKESSN